MTIQKIESVNASKFLLIEDLFGTHSFTKWLSANLKYICSWLSSEHCKVELFHLHLSILQADEKEWSMFQAKWRLWMIFLNQNVDEIWFQVYIYLNASFNCIEFDRYF